MELALQPLQVNTTKLKQRIKVINWNIPTYNQGVSENTILNTIIRNIVPLLHLSFECVDIVLKCVNTVYYTHFLNNIHGPFNNTFLVLPLFQNDWCTSKYRYGHLITCCSDFLCYFKSTFIF